MTTSGALDHGHADGHDDNQQAAGASATARARARARVLYIAGEGRSGSTVLEQAIAAHPHIVAVGELKYLWRWGIGRNEYCGCGRHVPQCPFWSAVGRRLFGPDGWAAPQAHRILTDYETVAANRGMFAAFVTPVLPSSRRRLARVRRFLTDLYAAVAAEAGTPVVVDASKHPMHLGLLLGAPGLDLTVVQLVRDPCGVTSSWSREVPLPHDPTGRRTMGPHPAPVVVARWSLINLAVHYVRARYGGTLVRYEDFCRRPHDVLAGIVDAADLDPGLLPATGDAAVQLAPGHGIAGNPTRFQDDRLVLREDTGWRQALPLAKRVAIKLAVLPQAIQYHYLGGSTGWTSGSASHRRSTTSTTS